MENDKNIEIKAKEIQKKEKDFSDRIEFYEL